MADERWSNLEMRLADLGAARDIGIIGVTLNRTVRNQMTALQQCVRRGGTVALAGADVGGFLTRTG